MHRIAADIPPFMWINYSIMNIHTSSQWSPYNSKVSFKSRCNLKIQCAALLVFLNMYIVFLPRRRRSSSSHSSSSHSSSRSSSHSSSRSRHGRHGRGRRDGRRSQTRSRSRRHSRSYSRSRAVAGSWRRRDRTRSRSYDRDRDRDRDRRRYSARRRTRLDSSLSFSSLWFTVDAIYTWVFFFFLSGLGPVRGMEAVWGEGLETVQGTGVEAVTAVAPLSLPVILTTVPPLLTEEPSPLPPPSLTSWESKMLLNYIRDKTRNHWSRELSFNSWVAAVVHDALLLYR